MRRIGTSSALCGVFVALLVTACAPQKQRFVSTGEVVPVEKRLAVATSYLVNLAVVVSDTASVQAGYATVDAPLDRLQSYANTAREAARRANQSLDDAISTGDRLGAVIEPAGFSNGRPRRYSHYWYLGRAKLDVARVETARAVSAADSVLACAAPACATATARSLQTHSLAAAGAAREAETLVRIAMIYVK